MFGSSASSMTMRSIPGAEPPCGGAPNFSAEIMPAHCSSTCSCVYPAMAKALYITSGKWLRIAPEDSRSEEHTSELQSLMRISYAVFCLKKKNIIIKYEQHPSLNNYKNKN